jgi:hypothetical protein
MRFLQPFFFFSPLYGDLGEQTMNEYCEKCGTKMVVTIVSSTPDLVEYRAKCPLCHTDFSAVLLPRQPAPVEPKTEDSSTQ